MGKTKITTKKNIVDEYLNNDISFNQLEKKHCKHRASIKRWVENYKNYGVVELNYGRKKKKTLDTFEKEYCDSIFKTHPFSKLWDVYQIMYNMFNINMCFKTFFKEIKNTLRLRRKRAKKRLKSKKSKENQKKEIENFRNSIVHYTKKGYKLIFIDESKSSNINTNNIGWCIEGKQNELVIENNGNTTTRTINVICAVSKYRFEYLDIKYETVKTSDFNEALKNIIVKHTSEQNLLFIMDNHPMHKSKKVQDTIHQSNNEYLYTPVAKPDFNSPIENIFSIIKTQLKNIVKIDFSEYSKALSNIVKILDMKVSKQNLKNLYYSWYKYIMNTY